MLHRLSIVLRWYSVLQQRVQLQITIYLGLFSSHFTYAIDQFFLKLTLRFYMHLYFARSRQSFLFTYNF